VQNHGWGDGGRWALWFQGLLPEFLRKPMIDTLGLRLAKLADLPEDVLSEAARVTELIEERQSVNKASSEAGRIAQRRKLFLRVTVTFSALVAYFDAASCSHLAQLRTQLTQAMEHSALPDPELLGYFARIQRETVGTLRSTLPTSDV
jgi:DNA mismatch repair protein MSH4